MTDKQFWMGYRPKCYEIVCDSIRQACMYISHEVDLSHTFQGAKFELLWY